MVFYMMKVDRHRSLLAILVLGVIWIQSVSTREAVGTDMPTTTKPRLADRLTTLPPSERRKLLQVLERNLLNMFGFKKKPSSQNKIHIPQYMLDLYRTQLEEPDLNFNVRGQQLQNANTARSFSSTEKRKDRKLYPTDKVVKYFFNISSIPAGEQVTASDLRIYREQLNITNNAHKQKHRVDIYEIIKPATLKRESFIRLLDTKTVDSRRTRWESFDIHPAVVRWREDPKSNHGLEVHVSSENSETHEQKHVRLRRSVEHSEEKWLREQPFLVTYSDDGKYVRSKRSTNKNQKRKRRNRRNRRPKKYRKPTELCRRHNLYVDFSDVGWNDWIVAPPGYDAYFCEGECVFPIADHYNATNHAVVQTLVNSVSPKAVPRACCVPTDLSPISMLYLDEFGKVVLKNYRDMVVEGCGCR